MEESLEKEYTGLGRPDSSVWEEQTQTTDIAAQKQPVDLPPTPPSKDGTLPRATRPASPPPDANNRTPSITSETPGRPAPRAPLPRALPLRVAPLSMNPPTRPGTADTESSRVRFADAAQAKIIGSSKRLSWSSAVTSKRPTKYGKGKFSRVELSPQPSDDPDDPLVSLLFDIYTQTTDI